MIRKKSPKFLVLNINIINPFYSAMLFNNIRTKNCESYIQSLQRKLLVMATSFQQSTFSPTRPSGPSWSSSHRVCRSVCLFVGLSVPFSCNFFQGLSLVLRSHDQILASHWSTLLPYHMVTNSMSGFQYYLLLCRTREKLWNLQIIWSHNRQLTDNIPDCIYNHQSLIQYLQLLICYLNLGYFSLIWLIYPIWEDIYPIGDNIQN